MRMLSCGIGIGGALVVCGASFGQVAVQAGPFTHPVTGHTYYRLTGSTDITAYRAYAAAAGGYLASINSSDENSFIDNTVLGNNTAYIGLTDENNEGTFRWDNGQLLDYTRWDDGEPNNDGNEDYGCIKSNGRWKDVSNWEESRAILEVSGNDTCGFATPLVVDGPMVVVDLEQATSDPLERNHCRSEWGFNVSAAIWLRFTGAGRPVTISTCDPITSFDTALQVLRGACGSGVCAESNNDGACFTRSEVTVFADAGVTYYVLLRGYFGDAGSIAIAGVRVFTTPAPTVALTDKRFRDARPYYRTTIPVFWQDAEAYAAARGGQLAAINTSVERNWVRTNYGNVLIGLSDLANEGQYVWSSGESGFIQWAAGEPNNFGTNEDFVEIKSDGLMNDIQGHNAGIGLIEFDDNEPCRGAIQLTLPQLLYAPYTPGPLTTDETTCGGVSARGMWFQFVGSGQAMAVGTCDPYTNFDTTVRVYSGECESLACVGASDDVAATCGNRSRVTFMSQAGMTYWVCVGKHADINPGGADHVAMVLEPGILCPADIDGNGIVNSTDVSAFINIWFEDQANGTLNADFNRDGTSNSTDVSDLINAYFAAGKGCI